MWRVVAAGMLLAACSGPAGAAQQSLPQVSSREAHAGCLHTDLRPCMISLGSALWFDMKLVTPQIAARNELDVNGRTAHRKIVFDASVPGHHEPIGITLTLASPAPNDRVAKVEVMLPEDPDLAHTASEYDRTYLYDVVSVLLGDSCPNLDKMALYRFYENSIKPREDVTTTLSQNGRFNRTTQTVDTEGVAFCGALFSAHRVDQWEGVPESTARRRHARLKSIVIE